VLRQKLSFSFGVAAIKSGYTIFEKKTKYVLAISELFRDFR